MECRSLDLCSTVHLCCRACITRDATAGDQTMVAGARCSLLANSIRLIAYPGKIINKKIQTTADACETMDCVVVMLTARHGLFGARVSSDELLSHWPCGTCVDVAFSGGTRYPAEPHFLFLSISHISHNCTIMRYHVSSIIAGIE